MSASEAAQQASTLDRTLKKSDLKLSRQQILEIAYQSIDLQFVQLNL